MNTNDYAGAQHARLYNGRSDKANAMRNQNKEFQNGYRHGMVTFGKKFTAYDLIRNEMLVRGESGKLTDADEFCFAEWKRGLWAARCQMKAAGIERLPRITIE